MNYLCSELGQSPVVVKGIFPVSPAEAFAAWTNPGEIVAWLGEHPNTMKAATIDLRIGGEWSFLFIDTDEKTGTLRGKYLEIIENEKLVFDWAFHEEYRDGRKTVGEQSMVTILFEAVDNGTQIHLTHENILSKDDLFNVGGGWNGTFNNFANHIKQ